MAQEDEEQLLVAKYHENMDRLINSHGQKRKKAKESLPVRERRRKKHQTKKKSRNRPVLSDSPQYHHEYIKQQLIENKLVSLIQTDPNEEQEKYVTVKKNLPTTKCLIAYNERQHELDMKQMFNKIQRHFGNRFISGEILEGQSIYELDLLDVNKAVFPKFLKNLEEMVGISILSYTEKPFIAYFKFKDNQISSIDHFLQHFISTYTGLIDDTYWKFNMINPNNNPRPPSMTSLRSSSQNKRYSSPSRVFPSNPAPVYPYQYRKKREKRSSSDHRMKKYTVRSSYHGQEYDYQQRGSVGNNSFGTHRQQPTINPNLGYESHSQKLYMVPQGPQQQQQHVSYNATPVPLVSTFPYQENQENHIASSYSTQYIAPSFQYNIMNK